MVSLKYQRMIALRFITKKQVLIKNYIFFYKILILSFNSILKQHRNFILQIYIFDFQKNLSKF